MYCIIAKLASFLISALVHYSVSMQLRDLSFNINNSAGFSSCRLLDHSVHACHLAIYIIMSVHTVL